MEQLNRLLASMTTRQKVSLAAAAVIVVAALFGLSHWRHEEDFETLYSGLAPEDAGQIVNRLREDLVEYRVTDGGATIKIPSSVVAETRLQMAASGLPQSGRIGYELFDGNNFGATDFAEQVNYHRALEGELERSVMALTEVERARVHLTLPKESIFLESRTPAKGSVMVKLRPGATLSAENVQAICHLAASAVQGLEPAAVSVMDMRGNLLNRPRNPALDGRGAPSEATLEYRQSIENSLLAKIDATLAPLLGPGGFRAGVTVDCDFTAGEESEEIYDPERSVMTTSQRTEDVSGANAVSGIPGTASNLPRPESQAAVTAGGLARRTENIVYQSSRTVRRLRLPYGDIRHMSVALLLDHEVHWEGDGDNARRTLRPPSEEKVQAIRDLVAAAVGLRTERGDQLIVESLPFESTIQWTPPEVPAEPSPLGVELPAWLQPYVQDQNVLVLAGIGAGAAILLFLAVAFFVLRRLRRKRSASVSTTASLPGGSGVPALEGGGVEAQMQGRLAEQASLKEKLEQEALSSLKLPPVKTKKAEVLTKHIAEEAAKDPAAMAQLVRTWLNEERD